MSGFIILVAAAIGRADPPPDPAALERRAVEARLAIHTLHVKLTIEQEWHDRYGQKGKGGAVRQFEIWLDATHYRADIFTEGAPTQRDMAVGRRHVLCRNCERPGYSIQYMQNSSVALMRSDSPVGSSVFADGTFTFDPRLIGYKYRNFNNMPHPASAKKLGLEIISPERSPPTVEATTVEGEAAWVLKSTWLRTGRDSRIYIFPGKGHSVGLIEGSGKNRYHSELEQDSKTGIWFPKKFVGEEFEDGVLKDRDTVTVHLREFNQPIDPAVFTLAGMNLPEGVEVFDPNLPPGGIAPPRLQYRDGQIAPYREKSVPPEAVSQPRPVDPSVVPGRYRWWYAGAALLFGIAAAVLIRRAIRSAGPRTPRPSGKSQG